MDVLFGAPSKRLVAVEEGLEQVFGVLEALQSAPPALPSAEAILGSVEPSLSTLRERLACLESLPQEFETLTEKMKDLIFAVAEGIERSDRAERRIHATISRARKELKSRGYEDPGLESEAFELSPVDGGGGGARELPPVPDRMEDSSEASSVAGVSLEDLRRVNSKRLRSYG